jgi:hypothetical protein
MKTLETTADAAIAGVVLGIALDAATVVMASAGPTGDTWSFRGNGALVVPIGFGGALLSGGWVGLILCARGVRAWLAFAVSIAAIAAIPPLLSITLLVAFGSAAQSASDLTAVSAFAWPVLSLAFVGIADARPAPSRRLPRGSAWFAAFVFSLALGVGFFGVEAALAPGGA